jgi:hypothetical protein
MPISQNQGRAKVGNLHVLPRSPQKTMSQVIALAPVELATALSNILTTIRAHNPARRIKATAFGMPSIVQHLLDRLNNMHKGADEVDLLKLIGGKQPSGNVGLRAYLACFNPHEAAYVDTVVAAAVGQWALSQDKRILSELMSKGPASTFLFFYSTYLVPALELGPIGKVMDDDCGLFDTAYSRSGTLNIPVVNGGATLFPTFEALKGGFANLLPEEALNIGTGSGKSMIDLPTSDGGLKLTAALALIDHDTVTDMIKRAAESFTQSKRWAEEAQLHKLVGSVLHWYTAQPLFLEAVGLMAFFESELVRRHVERMSPGFYVASRYVKFKEAVQSWPFHRICFEALDTVYPATVETELGSAPFQGIPASARKWFDELNPVTKKPVEGELRGVVDVSGLTSTAISKIVSSKTVIAMIDRIYALFMSGRWADVMTAGSTLGGRTFKPTRVEDWLNPELIMSDGYNATLPLSLTNVSRSLVITPHKFQSGTDRAIGLTAFGGAETLIRNTMPVGTIFPVDEGDILTDKSKRNGQDHLDVRSIIRPGYLVIMSEIAMNEEVHPRIERIAGRIPDTMTLSFGGPMLESIDTEEKFANMFLMSTSQMQASEFGGGVDNSPLAFLLSPKPLRPGVPHLFEVKGVKYYPGFNRIDVSHRAMLLLNSNTVWLRSTMPAAYAIINMTTSSVVRSAGVPVVRMIADTYTDSTMPTFRPGGLTESIVTLIGNTQMNDLDFDAVMGYFMPKPL